MTETRTQHRAICPVCFAEQAVDAAGRMAQHGYRRPYDMSGNVGACHGSHMSHFGTERGREIAEDEVGKLRAHAANLQGVIDRGEVKVFDRRGRVVAEPRQFDLQSAQHRAQRSVELMLKAADEVAQRVAAWRAAEPRAVKVEQKVSVTHMFGGRYRGKLCASSAMGAKRGYTTQNADLVTCPKCQERMAAMLAKKQAV